ncbi:MAG: NUDIX domain-containing protein [Candidatus Aenigmatarchaeota archaeon]
MSEQKYPEPTTGAVILNKKGEVLLCRSYKWFNKLTLPGGHIELGETAKEATKRETREEAGIEVDVGPLLLVQEFIFGPEFCKRKHFIEFDYLCYARTDEVKLDNDELQSFEWVNPEEALKKDIDPYTRKAIESYLKTKHA